MRPFAFRHNINTLLQILLKCTSGHISNRRYLEYMYRLQTSRKLNLDSPTTFCEKIQWLKLNFSDNRQPKMVDKYAVKQYVADIVGEKYVIPTIATWDTVDDIDFDVLPDQFVLKTTHGGGGSGVVVCLDKSTLDKVSVRRRLSHSMRHNIAKVFIETPYKYVHRRIIAEQYIGKDNCIPKDYKFFCFGGTPRFLKVDYDRFINHYANYYDLDWNILPFGETDLMPRYENNESRPKNFDEMIEVATKLAEGFPFLRVDLFNIEGRIYFGELTFFPGSGFQLFNPDEYEYKIGEMIKLPPVI